MGTTQPAIQGARSGNVRPFSRLAIAGVVWIVVYLIIVLSPLLLLLAGDTPAGSGFWWDFSIALAFAATALTSAMFVLTARIRFLTAPFGIDLIYFFHRQIAVVILLLIAIHAAILLMEEPLLVEYLKPAAPAYMLAGVGAFLLLALLVGSSLWRQRLRLGYDGWRRGHALLAVSAMALAMGHILGVDYYVSAPWKRGFWLALAITLGSLIVYVRLVKPLVLLRRPYRVERIEAERGNAWSLRLVPKGHRGLRFSPGQFVWLTLGTSPFAMREHPFSISSSAARPGSICVTVKKLGDFTSAIDTVAVGARAFVDGPFGVFSYTRHPAPGYVFIAGGIGIAPIMSMLRTLADGDMRVPTLLFYGCRRLDTATFGEALDDLAARIDLATVWVPAEARLEQPGEHGLIDAPLLARHLPEDFRARHYFICGPTRMMQGVERALHGLGVPLTHIHSEIFNLV